MHQVNGNFSGSVVVYSWLGDTWVPERDIVPVDSHYNMRFGGCLAVDGDRMVVGIEGTYWTGGHSYFGPGEHWFIDCVELPQDDSYSILVGPDQTLNCGDPMPEPDYVLGPGWGPLDEVVISTDSVLDCNAIVTVTYSIDDGGAHSASASQTYSFIDNQAPFVSTSVSDTTLNCNDMSSLSQPVFDDDCDKDLEILYEVTVSTSGCTEVQSRTWTATDDCGNESTFEQLVTYQDLEAPTIVCPDTLYNVLSSSDSLYLLPDLASLVSLTDNCDPFPTMTQGTAAGEELPVGVHDIVFTASDSCGNQSQCLIVQSVEIATGIDEWSRVNCLVYPNPADGPVVFESSAHEQIDSFQIVDTKGRLIQHIRCAGMRTTVCTDDMQSGLYHILILSPEGVTIGSKSMVVK